jgi:hypothetical protein
LRACRHPPLTIALCADRETLERSENYLWALAPDQSHRPQDSRGRPSRRADRNRRRHVWTIRVGYRANTTDRSAIARVHRYGRATFRTRSIASLEPATEPTSAHGLCSAREYTRVGTAGIDRRELPSQGPSIEALELGALSSDAVSPPTGFRKRPSGPAQSRTRCAGPRRPRQRATPCECRGLSLDGKPPARVASPPMNRTRLSIARTSPARTREIR